MHIPSRKYAVRVGAAHPTDGSSLSTTEASLFLILIILHWTHITDGQSWTQWIPINRPNSQIPQCTCLISHNTPFRTEMCTFMFWNLHDGLWEIWIQVYPYFFDLWHYEWDYNTQPYDFPTISQPVKKIKTLFSSIKRSLFRHHCRKRIAIPISIRWHYTITRYYLPHGVLRKIIEISSMANSNASSWRKLFACLIKFHLNATFPWSNWLKVGIVKVMIWRHDRRFPTCIFGDQDRHMASIG